MKDAACLLVIDDEEEGSVDGEPGWRAVKDLHRGAPGDRAALVHRDGCLVVNLEQKHQHIQHLCSPRLLVTPDGSPRWLTQLNTVPSVRHCLPLRDNTHATLNGS